MQNISDGDLGSRVRATIIRLFRLNPEESGNDLRLGAPTQWDSLGHMQLLVEIENEFGLRFPTYAIANLTTVDAIVKAIEAQRGTQS